MKFFPLALVALVASSDLDESGLLQVHSSPKASKYNPLEVNAFAQFTSRQVTALTKQDYNDLDPHTVDKFAMLLQAKLRQAEQAPDSMKAALLQRSMPSSGTPVARVIDQIMALPIKVQETLARQAKDSQALKDTLAMVPDTPEIHGLLLQMQDSQNPFDNDQTVQTKPVQGVTVTKEEGAMCADEAVTTKVRTTTTGWTTTTTHHNKCGTTTETLNNKTGYRHYHSYAHNGRGGNGKTVSQSSYGCWSHEHNHEHVYSGGNSSSDSSTESSMCGKNHSHSHSTDYSVEKGVNGKITKTNTQSETLSVDDDGGSWGHSHEHEHEHQHKPGAGTQSGTKTNTETTIDGKVRHSHNHELNHWHNEQTGNFSFDDDNDQ